MIIPASVPRAKERLLQQLVVSLSQVPHLAAVVLGGSYAGGTQHRASDLDIGLYYRTAAPFDLVEIGRIAGNISLPGSSPTVTGFYDWGPWVNGGAWIMTHAGKVDFLYRDLDQVERTIRDAQAGIVQHDYDQQPATGFYSVAYLAETRICIALYDPGAAIAGLKREVEIYPAPLKHRIIADSLWGAEFTLLSARGYAARGDVYNTVGCLTRAAACLTQALFALNEQYFLGDKRVTEVMAAFRILPPGYVQQIRKVLACPGSTKRALASSVAQMESAWRSVVVLTGGAYRPKFVAPDPPAVTKEQVSEG
jgi:hypothetical protein